jgi:hypothetical protein
VQTALGVAILSEQLGYFNILPMYVLFMLWAPLALALARRSPAALLALSFAVYGAVRYFGIALPSWPEPGVWFFNPLTWQFIFTLGVVCAILLRERPIPYSAPLYWACWALLAVSAVIVTDGFGLWPGLRDLWFARLDIDKSHLGIARLLHFAALCYALAQTSFAWIAKTALGRELERLGRHSLAVFGFGSIVAYLGQAAMKVLSVNYSGFASAAGLLYTLLGVVAIFLFARWLEGLVLWDLGSREQEARGSPPDFSPSPHGLSHGRPAPSPRP